MKSRFPAVVLALALATGIAGAQTTIFDENFDGGYAGYAGVFGTSSYSGGSPTGTTNGVLTSGGNPNGCWRESMTATTANDYYAGQVQLMSVSGATDPTPADYVLSFDAYGSQAGNIQLLIQTWPNDYFGGTGPVINVTVNEPLAAANTWQTFKVNLGSITTASPTGATWQFSFDISAQQWGGAGYTDTLKVDNIILTHSANALLLASSASPSVYGSGVNFTAGVETNGITAGNATGTVVFSAAGGPFSTNTLSGGSATSLSLTNLPVGTDAVTVAYSGGNYPAATNTFYQVVSAPLPTVTGQANLAVYTDNLVNGFANWSWAAVNLANNSPAPHSGSYDISVTDGGYQALSLVRTDINTTPYASLSFWINGGSAGGQQVQVAGLLGGTNQTAFVLSPLAANTWRQYTIPLSALGVAGRTNFSGLWIQGDSGGSQPVFYVDDIQLAAAAPPTVVHLGANAGQVLETVDARQFGLNTATWDGSLGSAQTLPLLQASGCTALRWPGGSSSDEYNWATDLGGNTTFRYLATNLQAQVFTTVNYGTGTPAEAAAWVLYANKTNNCNFKYWEIGNECYGTWETDDHAVQHDPYTYATNAAMYIQQMKAAFPSVPIKTGIVVVPGEDSDVNNQDHYAVNPITGATHYGWTPVVLSVMKSLGVLPDFLIYHFYAQYTASGWTYYSASPDSDPLLLQVAGNPDPVGWSDWASAAANLRQQITDYIGPAGTNIELCVTENNSDAGAMGRQSTSLVNALYLADSTCELMKTEFRSYIWWDLHNGADTSGDFDPTLYGWRSNGDYGVLNGSDSPYPAYYAQKLLQYFARPGDSVLNGTSDNLLLSAYAVHRTNGVLTMLVINKDPATNLVGQIALTNFAPGKTATVQFYGIPQDQAAEADLATPLQDLAATNLPVTGTNFTYAFPPLSLTLFTFEPGPATLSSLSFQSGKLGLLLQGQPGTPYVIQTSTNLTAWIPVSTNLLVGSSLNVTEPVSAGTSKQFFRAVWLP